MSGLIRCPQNQKNQKIKKNETNRLLLMLDAPLI